MVVLGVFLLGCSVGFGWVVSLVGFLYLGFFFLGATYELGALYPLYLTRPFGFFYIQHYLQKKNIITA